MTANNKQFILSRFPWKANVQNAQEATAFTATVTHMKKDHDHKLTAEEVTDKLVELGIHEEDIVFNGHSQKVYVTGPSTQVIESAIAAHKVTHPRACKKPSSVGFAMD